jgi:hypothetical protein
MHLDILPDILFTDEAQFTHFGINNTQNSHSWVHEHTHKAAQHYFQSHFSINVWCGVVHNYLTGLHFMARRLTTAYYRDFLQNNLLLYLEDMPLATEGQM